MRRVSAIVIGLGLGAQTKAPAREGFPWSVRPLPPPLLVRDLEAAREGGGGWARDRGSGGEMRARSSAFRSVMAAPASGSSKRTARSHCGHIRALMAKLAAAPNGGRRINQCQ